METILIIALAIASAVGWIRAIGHGSTVRDLRGQLTFAHQQHDQQLKRLREELAAARKNDNKDPKTGRFVKAQS